MRLSRLSIHLAIALVVSTCCPRAQANEATNAGFETHGETAGSIANWMLDSRAGSDATLETVADRPHGGEKCAKMTLIAAGSRASLRQKHALDQFCHYELSAWLRSDRPDTAIQVDLRELKGPQIPVAIKTFTIGSGWQKVTVRGYAPATVDGAISISSSAQGSVFVYWFSLNWRTSAGT
jgi:hypothetical protein